MQRNINSSLPFFSLSLFKSLAQPISAHYALLQMYNVGAIRHSSTEEEEGDKAMVESLFDLCI